MNISPLRIQDIRVDYDDAFIFLSATLLDRVPPTGTVDGPIAHQMTILEAFTKLRMAVYQGAFELYVKDLDLAQLVQLPQLPDMFSYKLEIVLPGSAMVYNAQVWYASKYKLVKYDFHTANSQPPFYSSNPVTVIHDFNTDVKLTTPHGSFRDNKSAKLIATNEFKGARQTSPKLPLTYSLHLLEGIAYNIDRFYDNCTITQIPNNGVDSVQDNANKKTDSSYILRMRTPLELFKIDNTYRFVGQRTTRGILCNVFESLRTDFQLPNYNGTFHSIFQFYFLETGWKETSVGVGSSYMQPVRLDITAIEVTK
ncbi:hypothetical protein CHS0354_021792 [Potamilus streckersoni]|uniref:LolA-like domain-containing protein n=1 Tax=Potamilus streckersoni TaxID=2493646 RepID=A0AAE0S4A7_9BIVA|nr:hypothetical protein CHS0354_021792 [Potamilus streckersoni]